MNIPDAIGELERAAEALAQAWDDHDCNDEAHEVGEDELAAEYDKGRSELARALLSRLDQQARGADLPTPLYSDVMTYDEVMKMIKEEMKE